MRSVRTTPSDPITETGNLLLANYLRPTVTPTVLADLNLFNPFSNDPVNHNDPDGRCFLCPVLIVVVVVGILTGCSKAPRPPVKKTCPSQWPPFDKLLPKKYQCGTLKGACDASCETVDVECTLECAKDCLDNFIKCGKGLL